MFCTKGSNDKVASKITPRFDVRCFFHWLLLKGMMSDSVMII